MHIIRQKPEKNYRLVSAVLLIILWLQGCSGGNAPFIPLEQEQKIKNNDLIPTNHTICTKTFISRGSHQVTFMQESEQWVAEVGIKSMSNMLTSQLL